MVSLVAGLLLAGCMDSSGIQPLATALVDSDLQVGEAIGENTDAGVWPEQQWWRAYGDPQLNHWVEKSLAQSPTLALAAARVREAEAMAGIAEAEEAPQGNFDASIQRKRWPNDMFYGPASLSRSTSWNNQTSMGLGYDLDIWGKLRNDHERTVSLAVVAATEQRAAALALESHVVRTYIQLALAHEHLDIARAELQQRETMLDLVRQRFETGLSTRFELSEAEAPIPDSHRQVDLMEEKIELTRNQLAALAGEGPGAASGLQRPTLTLENEPGLPASLPMELLGHRPDVVARRWAVVAEARGMDIAKADFYPNINLLGSLGSMISHGSLLDFLQYDKLTYTLGPAISLPVFDGGRRRGEYRAATARYDQAVEQYNQTLVIALRNVADQLVRLHSLHQQHGFIQEAVETARLRYQLAQESYARGLTDYRDVLSALTWLYEKRRIQEEIHAQQLSVQSELWVQLGGGMQQDADSPAEEDMHGHELALHILPE